MGRDEGGFALVAVLAVLAVLAVVGAEFAASTRLEAMAVRGFKDRVRAVHLVEAAVEQAIAELMAGASHAVADEDGQLTFHTRDGQALPRPPRERVPLGDGAYSYRLSDEEGRLDVNRARPDRLERLLEALGLERAERDVVVDSIQDWRDANEEHRLHGAESEDTYLRLPVPYRARNGNLESVRELMQIRGVTPALFAGAGSRPALAELVTVATAGRINVNTAPPEVLLAVGLAEAEVADVLQSRRAGPYLVVPGRFAGRGLAVATSTFRVEAEGFVDGRVAARATVILQRRGGDAARPVRILEWAGVR